MDDRVTGNRGTFSGLSNLVINHYQHAMWQMFYFKRKRPFEFKRKHSFVSLFQLQKCYVKVSASLYLLSSYFLFLYKKRKANVHGYPQKLSSH